MASSAAGSAYVAERLDHLGIVAGVCRGIGLVEWLDAQDTVNHERVSVGTATLAMILNGLGFSNRRVYLVPQFFATKPVERLLGPGISAEDLSDDCLGRTLDWLSARMIRYNNYWLRGRVHTLEMLQSLDCIYHAGDISRDEPFVQQIINQPCVTVPGSEQRGPDGGRSLRTRCDTLAEQCAPGVALRC